MPERLTLARHDHGPDHADWLAQFPGVRTRDIHASQVAELAGQARTAIENRPQAAA